MYFILAGTVFAYFFARESESQIHMSIQIEPGDILVRAGVINVFGTRQTALTKVSGEEFNHAGIAITSFDVHHVESNGFETIGIRSFFACANSADGAIIRFVGPLGDQIRARAALIAREKRYKKAPGNPFSRAGDRSTLNCNEFIYTIYQTALAEILVELALRQTNTYKMLIQVYGGRDLIEPTEIRIRVPGPAAPVVAKTAEAVGSSQADHPDVQIQFEGKTVCVSKALWDKLCLMSEAVLNAYTPDSFIRSPFFRVVDRRRCA